ncbi:hypothetical protein J1614_006643 [Plenodomus biglobosus]|nr:hypothetical protein J1614_006643 [Plenodomus biglobosus]
MSYIGSYLKRMFIYGNKEVTLLMATRTQDRGYWRSINAIDRWCLSDAMNKVEMALMDDKVLSAAQASRVHEVVIL